MAKSYEVTHKNLYLRVDGKQQRCEKGSTLELDPKIAEKLIKRGRIKEQEKKGAVKPDDAPADKAADKAAADK